MSKKVVHTYEDHLITRQNRAEKEFLAAFEAEKPTLDNAHVLVNPYFINPLCALILFKSEKPATATMTIHGKRNDRENIMHVFSEGTSHAIPVIGLYEGIATRVTVELSTGESKTFSIQSQPLAVAATSIRPWTISATTSCSSPRQARTCPQPTTTWAIPAGC